MTIRECLKQEYKIIELSKKEKITNKEFDDALIQLSALEKAWMVENERS